MNTKEKTGAENIRFDLTEMYSGINDPGLSADMESYELAVKQFNKTHKGNLTQSLPRALLDFVSLSELSNKLGLYVSLVLSMDVTNTATKAKVAELDVRLSRAHGEYLTFFAIELVAIEDAVLENLYTQDALVAKHRPWITQLRMEKQHYLSEEVEGALTKRAPFGPSAWSEFFDELEADLRTDWRGEQKTLTEMIHIQTESKDASERFLAMTHINDMLGGAFAKYSAQSLYVVAGKRAVEVRERGYAHPMDSRNKDNYISDDVVEALHKAVMHVAGPHARRYYRLKAKHLGLPHLRWSDRNAPMPFSDTTVVPWEDAVMTVHDAYARFSPTLADLITEMLGKKHVDAPAVKGKQSGAFNASVALPGNNICSFVFLNYLGSNRDVMTVAHEFGHGVHGMLAGKAQGALMMQAPIAYAETASVFGEMTTFEFLKEELAKKGDTEAELALIMGKIDDILNTCVRQIGFSNFERRLHGMDETYTRWGEMKKLSVEELDDLWLATLKELYGAEADVFTYENANHLWAYISHFHRPFYVYGYACGELLTQSLYAASSRLGESFEPLYLELLRAGSTKNVTELLAPFGLNPATETFWADGINVSLGKMVDEAEALSRKLGISF